MMDLFIIGRCRPYCFVNKLKYIMFLVVRISVVPAIDIDCGLSWSLASRFINFTSLGFLSFCYENVTYDVNFDFECDLLSLRVT